MSELLVRREPLFTGSDWDFDTIRRAYDACERVARDELGLDTYPNQIETITAEQMLDAYSSSGMPLFYKHWSFGKHFAHHEAVYRRGFGDLAYEIVINSNPCISYIMEENTATMQTLVIAHAAFGHNHFFKNNYLFRQWTDAEGILDYLDFAKTYISDCEERYGHLAVERLLDAAHALMSHAVHRYPRRAKPDLRTEERRQRERRELRVDAMRVAVQQHGARGGEALGRAGAQPGEVRDREGARARAGLDDRERRRAAEALPALLDLARPEVAEDRVHLGAGLVVALPAPREAGARVVAVVGGPERERHELGERDAPVVRFDGIEDEPCQRRGTRGEREVIERSGHRAPRWAWRPPPSQRSPLKGEGVGTGFDLLEAGG